MMEKIGLISSILWFSSGLYAADLRVSVTDSAGKPLANAVVSVKVAAQPLRAEKIHTILQQELRFQPDVLAVQRGDSVSFPNHDDTQHHVYSFSQAKSFELKLYRGDSPAVDFEQVGTVPIGCNIHDWMLAYIHVVDTPFYGNTNQQGEVNFSNLPEKTATISVWHPRLLNHEEKITEKIYLQKKKKLNLVLENLKPQSSNFFPGIDEQESY